MQFQLQLRKSYKQQNKHQSALNYCFVSMRTTQCRFVLFYSYLQDSSELVQLCKALINVIPFLTFKGTTDAFLLKISMTHNENRNPLLCLLIICISARSAPRIFSLKDQYTFRFPDFLINGFCNSFSNCCFVNFMLKAGLIQLVFMKVS